MKRFLPLFLLCFAASVFAAPRLPQGTNAQDPLLQLGLLDITKAPYLADPSGHTDATRAIQRAVNDARDHDLVCFVPEGTYLISDTISCEQQVRKLDKPRHTDGLTQHYWDLPHRIVLFGSAKGKRPVFKLAPDAKGFDDPAKPKMLVWIWAQTRHDAPGKQEPVWGKEQSNISFNHYFRGIDIDVRGHAGAIGIRHAGSQGSALFDSTILAEGAYAGMSDCCGQGGGTYNIQVIGGRHAIVIDPDSRFPILTGCVFEGQTGAAITYAEGGSQVPTLLVGCQIDSTAPAAIDLSTQPGYAGISIVDSVIAMRGGGTVVRTSRPQNIYVENTAVSGARLLTTGAVPLPASPEWLRVERFSSHLAGGVNLINGSVSSGMVQVIAAAPAAPDYAAIRAHHYQSPPHFDDLDAVNVKAFGAKGDGRTDDTAVFRQAIAASDKVFVPKGSYCLNGTIRLRPNTQLFGLTSNYTSIGGVRGAGGRRGPDREGGAAFTLATVDDASAAPGLSLLDVRGRIDWRSGRGVSFLASGGLEISGQGGGRFYGLRSAGRAVTLSHVSQPTALYAFNVERVTTNPQSEFKDCSHLRIYYFKAEAGTIQRANAGDGNTPGRIAGCRDVRVYCMVGNVLQLGERPMLEVADSEDIVVSQMQAFRPGDFPLLRETHAGATHAIPSTRTLALFVRDDGRKP
jgi:hypothetical protein